MKKLLTFTALLAVVALSSCKYDDDDLWSSVHGLEDRVAKLEELCKQMNTNIVSLQAIVNVLQESDYITGVAPVMQRSDTLLHSVKAILSRSITARMERMERTERTERMATMGLPPLSV